ncbi:hypothetical protein [Methylobacterium haplocladii]|uniref:Uncharacterized protein n=1 Tax=Methylobacterium haplocladii TaxID=1176176 RepID=A0A512ING9_9HYPH|nr:hypothetical protein [Methylobacterium haplocladii]GEO99251.1 hypothetical protein MHA02_16390 [Methylobacterium haplocladii]GJD83548.1 hypothetical protein HPGCJGGD_1417 [Methylobacterium haplocladii]GLS60301.1 hypothetical protein GCM10007887_29800 [Methylobacterium haplocladii]
MSTSMRSALTALAAFGALGGLSAAAEAHPLHHAAHHVAHHAQATRAAQSGQYMSTGFAEPAPMMAEASRRSWIHAPRDDDSANAKNPALPWYARGRGQETGGPDRMEIGQ